MRRVGRPPTLLLAGRSRRLVVRAAMADGRRITGRERLLRRLVGAVAVAAVVHVGREGFAEAVLRARHRDAVLRALRAGERGHDRREIELEPLAVLRLVGRVVPEPLLLGVGLHELEKLAGPPRELEVAKRLCVDREDRARAAELRGHVPDRGPVGERQVRQARAVELHELAHHTMSAEHLGHGQHEVSGGRSFLELAGQLEADHLRYQHRHGLPEHRGLGLDPADTPSQHAQAIDHRGVRVGADQRVGIGAGRVGRILVDEHDPREVLEVHLVDDAGVGRDNAEVLERALAPPQEGVALLVSLEFELGVALERPRGPEHVDLYGVVDHQLSRHQRIDLGLIAPQLAHRLPHRGEVDDRRDAGEVLHQDARRGECDLLARVGLRVPRRQRLDVPGADGLAVLVAQQVLEQDLQREGQPRDVELGLERVQPEDLVGPVANGQRRLGAKAVAGGGHVQNSWFQTQFLVL